MRNKDSILKQIELIKKHGGYINLARCSWSIEVFEHKAWPDDITSTSTTTSSLQGYYGLDDGKDIFNLGIEYKVPMVDTRFTSIDQAFDTIKMPMISLKTEGLGSLDYISLKDYINEASKRGFTHIKGYNIC